MVIICPESSPLHREYPSYLPFDRTESLAGLSEDLPEAVLCVPPLGVCPNRPDPKFEKPDVGLVAKSELLPKELLEKLAFPCLGADAFPDDGLGENENGLGAAGFGVDGPATAVLFAKGLRVEAEFRSVPADAVKFSALLPVGVAMAAFGAFTVTSVLFGADGMACAALA